MSAFLIDTDWCIEVLRGNAAAIHGLVDLRPHGLAMSLITYGELYEGAWYGRDPDTAVRQLRELLDDFTMLSLTAATMERYAVMRGRLTRNQRQQVGAVDLLIAATALEHDLTLLTYNLRDFRLIPDLKMHQPDVR